MDSYKRICVMMVMNVDANATISHQYVAPVLWVLVAKAAIQTRIKHAGKIIQAM